MIQLSLPSKPQGSREACHPVEQEPASTTILWLTHLTGLPLQYFEMSSRLPSVDPDTLRRYDCRPIKSAATDLSRLQTGPQARILFSDTYGTTHTQLVICQSIHIKVLCYFSGLFSQECDSDPLCSSRAIGEHVFSGRFSEPYQTIFDWMKLSAREGELADIPKRNYVSSALLLKVADVLDVEFVKILMEQRLHVATFDVMRQDKMADLLDKVPLKNLGVQLAAEKMARRIIRAEKSGDDVKARRVSEYSHKQGEDFSRLVKQKMTKLQRRSASSTKEKIPKASGPSISTPQGLRLSATNELSTSMAKSPPKIVYGPSVGGVKKSPKLELPIIPLELPAPVARLVPLVEGRRVYRRNGTYELQEVRPKRKPQAEFGPCCSMM